jgi:hypothetical protein
MDSRLERLQRAVKAAIEGMSSEQMMWCPADKWCAAEVLEHLYLTYTGTIKGFERVLEAGRPLAKPRMMKHLLPVFVVTRLGYLPNGRKAPPLALPRGLPSDKVRKEIGEKIGTMDAVIAQCETRFGSGVCLLDHTILGPLTGVQWRRFHLVHGLHHVKQILQLRENMTRSR